jgi:Flp pilus assembly protein TadB
VIGVPATLTERGVAEKVSPAERDAEAIPRAAAGGDKGRGGPPRRIGTHTPPPRTPGPQKRSPRGAGRGARIPRMVGILVTVLFAALVYLLLAALTGSAIVAIIGAILVLIVGIPSGGFGIGRPSR